MPDLGCEFFNNWFLISDLDCPLRRMDHAPQRTNVLIGKVNSYE